MALSTAQGCAQCGAPLGPLVNGLASAAVFDQAKPSSSSAYCSQACVEKSRGAPIVIALWAAA